VGRGRGRETADSGQRRGVEEWAEQIVACGFFPFSICFCDFK
jgi:hypothetical protein